MSHPYFKNVAAVISDFLTNLEADLEMERSVPEDADMTRNESTCVSLAYLTGSVEVLRVLPEPAQEQVLALLRVEAVDDLIPDLSTFDPWGAEEVA